MIGNVVPVSASTVRKKKSHRGPTVGRVLMIRAASPPHPITINRIEVGINDRIDGKDWVSMGIILS